VPAFLRRPLPLALLIAAFAQVLFSWRVTVPGKLVFDEVHYVPAARTLMALAGPANTEHPLLGKLLIGIGIALFGDGPLGWRALSTVAGTAVVAGVFALLWLGTRQLRAAAVGSAIVVLNFTVFVQARIAMLDGFMAAFVVWGAVCLLWAMRGQSAWGRWTAGAVLLGLATACKWAAAPYVAFAGIAFLLLRKPARWEGLAPFPALAVLGGVSVAAYALTFLPAFFYADQALGWRTLLPFQVEMYARQAQVLPTHPYESDWWSWPLDLRPIWYLYEFVDGAQRGILLLGNPAVMWAGMLAVAACAWGWLRTRDVRLGTAAGLWLASVLIWAAIPKSLGFFYYYYLPSIWLGIVLPVAFAHWQARLRYWDELFLVAAAGLFIHFYPILAAAPLAGPQGFMRWMWLSTWP
jgi:dolichyl-phosphate-mannose--protein O-mannosyl transferase